MKGWICALLFLGLAPKAISQEKALDFAKVAHFHIAIEPKIFGSFVENETVYYFPHDEAFYVKTTYKPDAKEKDLGFGSLHNPYEGSERMETEPKNLRRRLRGALSLDKTLLLLDTVTRQFLVFQTDKNAWQQPLDIILDKARPPRDARGEPTRGETSAFQSRLAKELRREKDNPDLITGIAELPKALRDSDGSRYAVWMQGLTRSLFTMRCDEKDFRSCTLQRACLVKGLDAKDYAKIVSITYDTRDDSLLLLNRSEMRILRIKGKRCDSLFVEKAIRLPIEMKDAQSIFVDKAQRLWIGLREAEGASSASLFVWNSSGW